MGFLGCTSSAVQRQHIAARDLAKAIRAADAVELLSLVPSEGIGEATGPFHGYEVFGTIPVDPSKSAELATALSDAIAASRPRLVACFYPRYGLRIKARGAVTDVVICFECSTLYVKREGSSERFNIEGGPEPLLNSWLGAAGIQHSVVREGSR